MVTSAKAKPKKTAKVSFTLASDGGSPVTSYEVSCTTKKGGKARSALSGRWLQNGLGDKYDAVIESNRKRTPMGRVCDPEDVAAAILSLVMGSQLVTGHIMPVEGGLLFGTL